MAMLSKETVTVGILAIASGLVSAYAIRAYLNKEQPEPVVEAKRKVEMLKIPMASLDLPVGRRIAAGDIAMIPVTRDKLFKEHSRPELVMTSSKDIIGRRLRGAVVQGEPFLTTGLFPAGTGPNLADKLKEGYRALSLYIGDGRSNGIEPGNFVDLLFRTWRRSGNEKVAPIPEMMVTLLTNIEVLDFVPEEVSTRGAVSPGGPGLVTLAVPVDQVSRIEVLQGRGDFALVPRSSGDGILLTAMGSDRITIEDALGIEPPTPIQPPFQTLIYRRGSPQVNTFIGNQLLLSDPAAGGPAAGDPTAGDPTPAAYGSQPPAYPTAAHGGSPRSAGVEPYCPECEKKKEANRAASQGEVPTPSGTPTPAFRSPSGAPVSVKGNPSPASVERLFTIRIHHLPCLRNEQLAAAFAADRARRGLVTLTLLLCMALLLCLLALAFNAGMLCCHQVKMQSAADAAALAAAAHLMDPLITGPPPGEPAPVETLARVVAREDRLAEARRQAARFAAECGVCVRTTDGTPAPQLASLDDEDVVAGWVEDPTGVECAFEVDSGEGPLNAVEVRAMRSKGRGDPITLWMGRLLGLPEAEVTVVARAAVDQRVFGFRPVGHVNVPMVPLVILAETDGAIAPPVTTDVDFTASGEDRFSADIDRGRITPGPDGIAEVVLRIRGPAEGDDADLRGDQEAALFYLPGGPAGADAWAQQTLVGFDADDLADADGQIAVSPETSGLVLLRPSLSLREATVLGQSLRGIRGQKRIWAVGSRHEGTCRIVGFVAGCVVECQEQTDKGLAVTVQPCAMMTPTALTATGVERNRWIGKLMLIR